MPCEEEKVSSGEVAGDGEVFVIVVMKKKQLIK